MLPDLILTIAIVSIVVRIFIFLVEKILGKCVLESTPSGATYKKA